MNAIKIPPIVIENITFPGKKESNSENSIGNCRINEHEQQKDISIKNLDLKYDKSFHDNVEWRDDESADFLSEGMIVFLLLFSFEISSISQLTKI